MKTSHTTRVPGVLDEHDRAIIKEFCKLNKSPLRAVVDLNKNSCMLYVKPGNEEIMLGRIQKIVYKDTFVLLNQFKYFPNRKNSDSVTTTPTKKFIILQPGTEIFTDSENKNKFWIPVENEYVLIDRYIMVKSAVIRQKYELYLINPEENIGVEENQKNIELIKMLSNVKSTYKTSTHVLS